MVKLSNDVIREGSMRHFLSAVGFNLSGVHISSIEGLYGFSFDSMDRAKGFATRLNKAVQNGVQETPIRKIGLADLIGSELEKATCGDAKKTEMRRRVCKAIFEEMKSLNSPFSFSQETGLLEVTLPDPDYAPAFNLLEYPHMTCTDDGKLALDINKILTDIKEGVLRVEGIDKNQIAMIFLNSKLLSKKQLFFATKDLGDDQMEVTPYFFAPETPKPPEYHFVLDVSGSMQDHLAGFKTSVKSLVELIFAFQPNATLSITTFTDSISSPISYTFNDKDKLMCFVDRIIAEGGTALYRAAQQFVTLAKNSVTQNNILLVSDGENTSSSEYEPTLQSLTEEIGTNPTPINSRNKFYVISFRTQQGQTIQRVVKTFGGEIIDVNDPEFLKAIQDPDTMKRWAAARELLKTSIVVTQQSGMTTESNYQKAVELSGQIVSLNSGIYKHGEKISVTITDSKNQLVVASSTTVTKPAPKIANAQIITNLGHRQNAPVAASTGLTGTPSSNSYN